MQDYLFLLDYVRLFALAAARAPDTDTLGRLVDLAYATFHQELSLHRGYAAGFGLAEADLEQAEKSPGAPAYTDFLLRTPRPPSSPVLAALLHIELLRAGRYWPRPGCRPAPLPTLDPDLRRPRVRRLAAWCASLLDQAADSLPAARLAACERAFLASLPPANSPNFWDAE